MVGYGGCIMVCVWLVWCVYNGGCMVGMVGV